MKQKTTRQGKVSSEIKKVVSEFLMRNPSVYSNDGNAVLVSVTDVEISPCLKHAKIFVSHFGGDLSDEDILTALSEISPKVRYQVGKEVKLRFVPEINFFIDDTYEKAQKIDQILESVNEKSVSQSA